MKYRIKSWPKHRARCTGAVTPNEQAAPLPLQIAISRHPFLADLSPHHLRLLSDCAMPNYFTTGELIIKEGDPADCFYPIEKGRVAVECNAKGGDDKLIQLIGSGEVLGWSWLFLPYCWHFNARALEPTESICIYATPLRDECEWDHELGHELFKRMAGVMLDRLQATRRKTSKIELNAKYVATGMCSSRT